MDYADKVLDRFVDWHIATFKPIFRCADGREIVQEESLKRRALIAGCVEATVVFVAMKILFAKGIISLALLPPIIIVSMPVITIVVSVAAGVMGRSLALAIEKWSIERHQAKKAAERFVKGNKENDGYLAQISKNDVSLIQKSSYATRFVLEGLQSLPEEEKQAQLNRLISTYKKNHNHFDKSAFKLLIDAGAKVSPDALMNFSALSDLFYMDYILSKKTISADSVELLQCLMCAKNMKLIPLLCAYTDTQGNKFDINKEFPVSDAMHEHSIMSRSERFHMCTGLKTTEIPRATALLYVLHPRSVYRFRTGDNAGQKHSEELIKTLCKHGADVNGMIEVSVDCSDLNGCLLMESMKWKGLLPENQWFELAKKGGDVNGKIITVQTNARGLSRLTDYCADRVIGGNLALDDKVKSLLGDMRSVLK